MHVNQKKFQQLFNGLNIIKSINLNSLLQNDFMVKTASHQNILKLRKQHYIHK